MQLNMSRINCWPSPEQSLLLKSIFVSDETKALECWLDFCRNVDIQQLDYVSTNFMPLAYKRFNKVNTSEIKVAKSVYRHTWSRNSIDLHALKGLIERFNACGIPVTLLKGAALILNYYKDPGLRVVGDFDVLVNEANAFKAFEVLEEAGWSPLFSYDHRMIVAGHALAFKNKDGLNIDLHWRIISDSPFDQALKDFEFETVAAIGCNASVLCPEDQLIHTLLHCLKYSPVPLTRWIPDATMIIRGSDAFRWEYLFAKVESLRIQYIVKNAITYLQANEYIRLPDEGSARLSALSFSSRDKRYFDLIAKPSSSFLYLYQYVWHLHARNHSDKKIFSLLLILPAYLKESRGLANYWDMCRFLATRAWSDVVCKLIVNLRHAK